MKLRDLLVALIASLVAGLGVLVVLNGPGLFTPSHAAATVATIGYTPDGGAKAASATPTNSRIAAVVSPTTTPRSRSIPTRVSPTATPTLVPLEVGMKKGEDLESVLLLYDSSRPSNFDINFCKIAAYYGLKCKKIALDRGDLTEDLLRDSQGNFFKLIGVSADTLLAGQPRLKNAQIALIDSAVETGGANLFVAKVHSQPGPNVLSIPTPSGFLVEMPSPEPNALAALTDGAIVGAIKPQDAKFREWSISTAAPEITREFTGQVISYTLSQKYEYALALGQQASATTLITSTNAAGATYPVFVRYQRGKGSIFVDSGEEVESLEKTPLSGRYGAYSFSQVIPLMMTVRYALGDRAWHTDHKYANLTIDDYSHEYELFKPGIDTFGWVADQMNQLPGGVEWRNPGYIIKRLYLEKTNGDGSVDIKMYGNDLIITPRPQAGVTYHIMKEETLNVPIKRITVNGHEFPYRIEQGLLKLDVVGPVDGSPFETKVLYGE